MLPALLLGFCRVIKQAGAAEEAEAAHSYQLSHLGRTQRGAEEPVPTAQQKSKHPEKLLHLKSSRIFGPYWDFGLHVWSSYTANCKYIRLESVIFGCLFQP